MLRRGFVFGGFAGTLAMASCNAILGNEEHYVVPSEAGASGGRDAGASNGGTPGGGAGGRDSGDGGRASGGRGNADSGVGGAQAGAGGAGAGGAGAGAGGDDGGAGGVPSGAGGSETGGWIGAGGRIVRSPSCQNLANTCGPPPARDRDCCASSLVDGDLYNRSNDAAFPATISDFRLDDYEITVGRFRKFVAAFSTDMTPEGAGRNPNDPTDPGWSGSWNVQLPPLLSALIASVKCNTTFQTWTDTAGAGDNRPINCISWYVAQAFCIWDGGRLPTEAEWNYAAAGGGAQRLYPWGPTVPGPNYDLTIWGCYYPNGVGPGGCTNQSIAPVGTVEAGNGLYGQADLSGNLWEWVVDWYADPYPQATCSNCANFSETVGRVIRSGEFGDYRGVEQSLLTAHREPLGPAIRENYIGARCARAP